MTLVMTPAVSMRHAKLIAPTLGVEEELQIVGPDGALAAHDVARGQRDVPDRNGTSSCEIHRCALEIQTPVTRTPSEAVASVAEMRHVVARRACRQGQRVLSAALHPFSQWVDQTVNDDPITYPHYAHLLREYGDVARGAMSFGLHVHTVVSHDDLKVPVMNRLRTILPLILALSVNAPFFQGRDTGLQSWRHSLFDCYPRTGVPEVWETDAAYWAHVERLRQLGILESNTGLLEDLRIHCRFGTLEIRIMDCVHSLDRMWLILALLQAEIVTLEAELKAGCAAEPIPRLLLEENKWRARRYGMQAELIDWILNRPIPYEECLYAWVERLAPAATRLGFGARLHKAITAALQEGTPADQQRRWLAESGSMSSLVSRLVEETARPLSHFLNDPEV